MKNSKIRIYELKYDLYDLVDRYQSKGIIFPSQNILQQHRQNITREAINALLYGIPYPQVYVSELQNGQLLVLETDKRLQCLIEFIVGKFDIEMPELLKEDYIIYKDDGRNVFFDLSARDRQDILRTKIPICIIEYETPVYMHLRIGAYIGNWTVEQEEAVRRVLYADKGIYTLQMALRDAKKTSLRLVTEAEFVVFLTYIVNFVVSYPEDCEEDQYAMQDNMFNYVRRKELNIDKLACLYTEARKCFTDAAFYYRYGRGRTPLFRKFFNKFSNIKPARGHILGMAACLCSDIYDKHELVEMAYRIMQKLCDRDYAYEIEWQLRYSDLSKRSVKQILNELRRFV